MKSFFKLPLFAFIAMFAFSCSTERMDDDSGTIVISEVTMESKTIEVETLELINDYRLSKGLNPLEDMDIVKSVAYSHTDYMLENNKISHDYFFKRSEYLKSHTGAERVSENVAYGYSSAKTLVTAWLESEGHRHNIEGDFTNFDISAEQNENGRWYYTNIFIKK
ncbi:MULTISPECIES: CAP domain-containing protein [unclassified Algibacter]|uniref:CAP domain-containing protein n=1 Tax=unclassified Algibacter TaxID=2615009 RepID=UPI00131DDB81|nr:MULTISPECIES: CAP domain-containing protein [unclassified Algibacter]MCL5128463.1 CAP domain-containing protein [Algibacter sp. L4_22]